MSKLGGVHTLITGLNGQGKTLYLVGEVMRGLVKETLEIELGRRVPRRLCVSGIRGLVIEHQVIDAPPTDPEKYVDTWRDQVREPGFPVVPDVHRMVQNWWLWCEPGDVIVVDECQRVFRPFAAGRRIPMFIEKLETARHYGVQFVYVTQHPSLLHTNVRNLVGPHWHIARVLGGVRTVVYEWPVATNPDRTKSATKRFWKHDKSAFGLYESSQLHTKFGQKIPFAVFGLVGGLAVLGGAAWFLKERLFPSAEQIAARSKQSQAAPGQAAAPGQFQTPDFGQAPGRPGAQRPGQAGAVDGWRREYRVGPAVPDREPWAGYGVHLAGSWTMGNVVRAVFSLSVDGRVVATVSLADAGRAGYAWRSYGPCAGVLIFGGRERPVGCDTPQAEPGRREPGAPAGAASSARS